MTLRERIMAVYRGETPDVVPYMLDLSHWFYHKHRLPWDLSRSYVEPERALIDYHKQVGAGFYLPNLASFYSTKFPDDVSVRVAREEHEGVIEIAWAYSTPMGMIERRRIWSEDTYAWGIREWGVRNDADLMALAYALENRTFTPHWDRYRAWTDCVGDAGVVYLPIGYSAVGELMNLWMGIEGFIYAAGDWPSTLREVVDRINASNLGLIDLVAESPAEIIVMGDNFSSDVQPPRFFDEWSRTYYEEAVRRLHRAGKKVAVHIDGRLRGALGMIRSTGADCADAVTPIPMGDLTPEECRAEAGPDLILSGGISPDLWLPTASTHDFTQAVIRWLDLRTLSPRLIANAGDQVPPGAVEDRIHIMRDLIEQYGRFICSIG